MTGAEEPGCGRGGVTGVGVAQLCIPFLGLFNKNAPNRSLDKSVTIHLNDGLFAAIAIHVA